MGQAVNKLLSLTKRELKMYNVERRAEKVISKDKPTPAPMYPSTEKELQRLKEENVSTEYLHKKDENLNEYLKKVYVTSPDSAPPLERKINPDRPLPVNRTTDVGITYGYSESEEANVPEGKVSLKQALTFINNHQDDPKKFSNAVIASQYKISLEDANDILEHFKMFSVKVYKKEADPAQMSTYERLQHKIKQMTVFNAPDVVKEVDSVFGKGELSADVKRPDEKISADKEHKKEADSTATKTVHERLQQKIDNMNPLNAPEVMKEMAKVYGRKEKEADNTKPDEKDSLSDINNKGNKEEIGSEKTIGESNVNVKNNNLEKGKVNVKPEGDIKKVSTRKRSQENG